ncbi:hypothetical protein C0J52_21188 [Blattella germanica]|nr:hypothetical protein C0J52_21188 [Blattella germanica]
MTMRGDDIHLGKKINDILDELSEEEFDSDFTSDTEDNVEYQSDHNSEISDSELSGKSDDEESDSETLQGKNGHSWTKKAPPASRTPARNLVLRIPGPRGRARSIQTEVESWEILFSEDMVECITVHTNEEIERQAQKYSESVHFVGKTDKDEIKALIGLLYISGEQKDNHLKSTEMWSCFGAIIYCSIMSESRFRFLINCLRFDDKERRNYEEKFFPIRGLWASFIDKCTSAYTPHEYLTIDEQLLGFRGNCPFRVYISNKPDKYGMKIVTMCDARTYYMVNAIPYVGKVVLRGSESVPSYYVKKLSEPVHGTGWNITCDNWFTSIPLADTLLKEQKLTIVCTLRKNKREIPSSFLSDRKKQVLSSQFALHGEKMLVSFCPKKGKSVIMLSTMHQNEEIDEESKKPEVILFYNCTKGGVDTFDQLTHNYTVARKTRRWPLRFFYGMLDQAAINAFILYKIAKKQKPPPRRSFLKVLGLELARPHLLKRLQKPIPRELVSTIHKVLGTEETVNQTPAPAKVQKRSRCAICPRNKDRKTQISCIK